MQVQDWHELESVLCVAIILIKQHSLFQLWILCKFELNTELFSDTE
jgi:hypothetical protein